MGPLHQRLIHLGRRFFGALDPRGPSPAAEAAVAAALGPGEQALWRRMSGPDRRHAVGVADRVRAAGVTEPWAVAAALLHDVGKVDSGLGTLARVPATLIGMAAGRRAATGSGRVARYLRHDAIGAELLRAAGADPLTAAWAGEHHLPPERWTVDAVVGAALKAADDD